MKPFVSVLMPAYNAEKTITRAVESILNQTYDHFELLITDDCSTDNTWAVISSFTDPRIRTFRNASNQAVLHTTNGMFAQCKGDLIAFQDADDYSDLTRLEKQVAAFSEDSALGICGTYGEYYDYATGAFLRAKTPETGHEAILEGMYRQFQFCGPSMMVSRAALEAVGGYREYFDRINCEHYDWAFLIVEKFRGRNIAEPLYKYTTSPNSLTRNIKDRRKMYTDKIVQFLARERRDKGTDSLMGKDRTALEAFVASMEEPYLRDSSLLYRNAATKNYYSQAYKNTVKDCLLAIREQPLKLVNYRHLFYYMRKIGLGNLK